MTSDVERASNNRQHSEGIAPRLEPAAGPKQLHAVAVVANERRLHHAAPKPAETASGNGVTGGENGAAQDVLCPESAEYIKRHFFFSRGRQ